jgi:hypothetical protein
VRHKIDRIGLCRGGCHYAIGMSDPVFSVSSGAWNEKDREFLASLEMASIRNNWKMTKLPSSTDGQISLVLRPM